MGALREGPGLVPLTACPPLSPSRSTLRFGVWDFRGPARRLCDAGGTVAVSEGVSSLLKPARAWGLGGGHCNGWRGWGAGRAGGPVQVTLLSKARVFGLTPPVLAWGQRGGVRNPALRGCPLSPILVFSLPPGAAVVCFLWPPCAPLCGLPDPCWRASPARPPCLPALLTSCGMCSRLGLGRGCCIPVAGTPCRSGPLS